MGGWSLAWRLAWMELRTSLRTTAFLLVIYSAMSVGFATVFEVYARGDLFIYDLMFLFIFLLFPAWMKGKDFQVIRIGHDLWTSPAIVMLQQLPITKETIVKSRFLIYLSYSFVFLLMLLGALPVVSAEFRDMMTPLSFVTLFLVWFSFSVAVGLLMAASEAGGNYSTKSFVIAWIQIIAALAVLYIIWRYVLPAGLLMMTIQAAKDWTLITLAAAVVAAIAGWNLWQHKMKGYMNNADY